MNIFKKLFCRKQKEETTSLSTGVVLGKVRDHFVIAVGDRRCDGCTKETMNCYKLDIDHETVCICPRRDIKGFRKPKAEL